MHHEIEINITVSLDAAVDKLPLIDYTVLHAIAQKAVAEPAQLLETIVQRVVQSISGSYPDTRIMVSVRKHHPPMAGIVDYSEVKWES